MKNNLRYRNVKPIFIEENVSNPDIFKNLDKNVSFDVVSCQFALHYLFDKEENARNTIKNICLKLSKDGYFICCIPDANSIVKKNKIISYFIKVKRLREYGKKDKDGNYVVENQFYSMKFNSTKFPKSLVYGIKYGFYLENSIGKKQQISDKEQLITYVPEYLIEFQNFIKLMKSYDLELVSEKNFINFYEEEREEFSNLFVKFKLTEETKMNSQLWDISHLYKACVFKKIVGHSIGEVDRSFISKHNLSTKNATLLLKENEISMSKDQFF